LPGEIGGDERETLSQLAWKDKKVFAKTARQTPAVRSKGPVAHLPRYLGKVREDARCVGTRKGSIGYKNEKSSYG
jgi:hypothetical protein